MAICKNKKCSIGECDQTEGCADYVPVISNADRIRAMTDEELAKNLVYEMCNYCHEHRTEKCYRKCADNMLEWLKRPAE